MSSTTPHERSALLHFPASNSNTIEESIEDVNINKTHTFRNLFFTILLFIGVTLVLISPYSNIFQTKFLVYNTTDEQNTTVNNYKIDENNQNFPINFVWGVATSSYQIEGGVNEGGRGETIWDVFVQQPNTILDNSTGSIADDNYHQWKNDIALISEYCRLDFLFV